MIPKPKHLEPEYATQFKDRSVVEAYHHRPLYPPETFEILSNLITDEPRAVLDVGCGIGDIARRLVDFVDRVDAVDFSQGMIKKGKRLPGGDHPNLNWLHGPVEEVPLQPPYALITAGESLHWMEWDIVFPRFKEALTPRGYVAISERGFHVIGVDISRTAIEHARRKALKCKTTATFLVGDVCCLEGIRGEQFDIVVDGHCLHCLVEEGDRKSYLKECYRLLHPGGAYKS